MIITPIAPATSKIVECIVVGFNDLKIKKIELLCLILKRELEIFLQFELDSKNLTIS